MTHGTLFKAYPSGILENPTFKVQSWELASGNTAILEAKWPWPGKFTFHFHGIREERGAMGYFNVTNAPANAIDGKDVAITKSINMNDWQTNLTKSLQKADSQGKITAVAASTNEEHHGMQTGMEKHEMASSSSTTTTNNATQVLIVKGATTLDKKAFSPNHIKVKVDSTVIWTNDDSNIHTVTSGVPNTPNVGQVFDSGLTSLISPSKTYAVVDKQTGKVASAKNPRKWGKLFDFRSIIVDSPSDDVNDIPPVRITFPDGSNIFSDHKEGNDINSRLSEVFDREITLMKSSNFEEPSYEEYWPDIDGMAQREKVTDENMPSKTFFDIAVIHILTTSTINRLRELYPEGRFEVRQFRQT
jgi:plastocyanin